MASNLDYLNPDFIPLQAKVQGYLDTEKALRDATAALRNEPAEDQDQARSATEFVQRPPTGSYDQDEDELTQTVANLRDDLARQQAEIIALLPTRDEWIKINLGYGPSRVGAWHVPAVGDHPERFELRVVH